MPSVPSNASNVVGRRAVVVIAIEPGPGQRGQVRVGTEHWSAKSENEQPIGVGATVEVARIDGVALVVRPVGDVPALGSDAVAADADVREQDAGDADACRQREAERTVRRHAEAHQRVGRGDSAGEAADVPADRDAGHGEGQARG